MCVSFFFKSVGVRLASSTSLRLCKKERSSEELEVLEFLAQNGIPISREIAYSLLQGCIKRKDLGVGRRLRSLLVRSSKLASVAVLGDHLIRLFGLCGSLQEAEEVFHNVSNPSSFTWNAIISAHTKLGESKRALELFDQMQQSCVKPDKVTFLCVLHACSNERAIGQGRLIHCMIVGTSFDLDVVVATTLIDMYAKFGSLEEAQQVFNGLPEQNVVAWGAMMAGYAQQGLVDEVLIMFEKLQAGGMKPSEVILLCILKAFGSIRDLWQGRLIHEHIIRSQVGLDVVIGTSLVDMYAKCGSLQEAEKILLELPNRNVVSWGAIMSGYVQHGHGSAVFELFEKMQLEGIKPDKFIFSCIFKACSNIGADYHGRLIHDMLSRSTLASDVVIGSSMVDMYAKSGNLEEARIIFESLPNRNVVSWGAMIAGYAQNGHGFPVLQLFEKMEKEGIQPDKVMFTCILKACGNVGAIRQGKLIHNQIVRRGLHSDVIICSNLVDMYAKCSSLGEACKIFEESLNHDMVSWSSIIAAYAQCSNWRLGRQCLDGMLHNGLKPDGVMFIDVLTACSHSGSMEDGLLYFESMRRDKYSLPQRTEHFNCVVDLLSRTGQLNEAKDVLNTMPTCPNITGWMSLLTGCRTYGNMELGRWCFDKVVQLDPVDASAHVLMASIYADACLWEEFEKLKQFRRCAGLMKVPGRAWIEIDSMVQEFIVGSKHHSHSNESDVKIERVTKVLKGMGYLPRLDVVSESLFVDERENVLFGYN